MRTVQFPIQNVTCDACEKVIGRLLTHFENARIESISPDARTLTLSCEEGDVEKIREGLREYNYLNDGNQGKGRHVGYVVRKILENHPGFQAERELVIQSITLMGILFMIFGIAYGGGFIPNTLENPLLPILFLVPFGIAINAGALLHVRQLRHHFTCTNGMMAGMIIGMMAGFMGGALVGATNGMFVGSIIGMTIGMGASSYAVRKTGIMGILEGWMAGLMAGTMGAMLSVMMIADNLVLFLYILFGVCAFILGGMSYFIVKEVGAIHRERKEIHLVRVVGMGIVFMILFLGLILYGPKSPIAFGGTFG